MNNNNPLHSITELREIDSYERANDYLAVGWTLLNIHTVQDDHPSLMHQKTIYDLGWPRELGEAMHPTRSDIEMDDLRAEELGEGEMGEGERGEMGDAANTIPAYR